MSDAPNALHYRSTLSADSVCRAVMATGDYPVLKCESPGVYSDQERDGFQSPCLSSNSLPSQMIFQLNQDADITDLFGAQGAAVFSPTPTVIIVDNSQHARELTTLNEQTMARSPARKAQSTPKETPDKDEPSSPIELDLASSSADESPSTAEDEDPKHHPPSQVTKQTFSSATPLQPFRVHNRKPHPERRKRRSVPSNSPISVKPSTKLSNSYMRKCWSCSADSTPCWRPAPWIEGESHLCNGCGLRYKKSGVRCTECRYIPSKGERAAMLVACVKCSGSAVKD